MPPHARRRFWRVARAHPRALLMQLFWNVLARTLVPVMVVKWVRGMWMKRWDKAVLDL
jgi:hypothetical protein